MGTFISPTVNDVSPVAGGDDPAPRFTNLPMRHHRFTNLLMRHVQPSPRGRHVVKTGGIYETKDTLTEAEIAAADVIRWPDGSLAPAVFFGGHATPVTDSEGASLTAAGYTVITTGLYPAIDLYPSTSLYPAVP